ncbi:Hsp70 family protein [Escherichia coli]
MTVPADFNDAQRQATKDAGCIAGLDVNASSTNRLQLLRLRREQGQGRAQGCRL